MARTYRNLKGMNRCALRNPKTTNERKTLIGLLQDNYVEEYQISGINRLHSRLANCVSSWDDIVISGYKEMDYKIS